MTREEDEEEDDLGLVPNPFRPKLGMNLCNRLQFKLWDRPRSSHSGSWTTSGDADDNGESSPSTSMATMSVASLPVGEDMAHSGAAYSDGVEVVRCGATGSDGAEVVRCGATSSN